MKKLLFFLLVAILLFAGCNTANTTSSSSVGIGSEQNEQSESTSQELSVAYVEKQYTIVGKLSKDKFYFTGIEWVNFYFLKVDPDNLKTMYEDMDQHEESFPHNKYDDSKSKISNYIQVDTNLENIDLDSFIGETIEVTGTTFFAHSIYHIYDIFLIITEIKIID